jgi:hypothetical protein
MEEQMNPIDKKNSKQAREENREMSSRQERQCALQVTIDSNVDMRDRMTSDSPRIDGIEEAEGMRGLALEIIKKM